MTPKQCLEARNLLGLTKAELAAMTQVPRPSIALYEQTGHLSAERVEAIRASLESAGANFSCQTTLTASARLERTSGLQCREARVLLGWTQRQLAGAAGLKWDQVGRFEAQGSDLPTYRGFNRAAKIRVALEAAGVEFFVDNGAGPGVRLRNSESGD